MNATTVISLYHSGALICAGIVAVYLLLRWLSTHIAWLEVPARAHYVTAALAVLGALAVTAATGSTPNLSQIIAAVAGNILLFLPGLPPIPARKPQGGRARLTLLALLGLFAVAACSLSMGCGAAQKKALKDLATCSELAAVKDLTPTVENIIAEGTADWKQNLIDLGKRYGTDELACAVQAAAEFFASPAGTAKMGAILAAEQEGSGGKVSAESAQAAADGAKQRAAQWLAENGYAAPGGGR